MRPAMPAIPMRMLMAFLPRFETLSDASQNPV
jgi:hypothetical protein